MDYGDGGSGFNSDYDNLTLHCNKCQSIIFLNKDKYFISRKILNEKVKEFFGKKVETRYLCQQCHREEQLDQIV